MAVPKVRYDAYGRPLPQLSEASRERLHERPFNRQQQRNLVLLLEELHEELLRRGTYADVTLQFSVKDGVLTEEVRLGVVRRVVCPRDS